jgi:hypothetical protein
VGVVMHCVASYFILFYFILFYFILFYFILILISLDHRHAASDVLLTHLMQDHDGPWTSPHLDDVPSVEAP